LQKEKVQKDKKEVAPEKHPEGRLKRSHKKMAPAEPSSGSARSSIVKRIRKRRRWGVFKKEASGSLGARSTRSELLAAKLRALDERAQEKQAVGELQGKGGDYCASLSSL
jgi:hypothetical protein